MYISAITYKNSPCYFNSLKKPCKKNDNINNDLKNQKINFSANYNLTSESSRCLKKYSGCLIGGAIGDALGNPVEFLNIGLIEQLYGKQGIVDLALKHDKKAEITDDTQMTIFTADGLIKSSLVEFSENNPPDFNIIYSSYLDWLNTQESSFSKKTDDTNKGWIYNIDRLHAQRAPGMTCIGSLSRGIQGSIESPINNSKGCGGVMRVAPVGLMYYKNAKLAFEVGARCAALTHGSPEAYLSAGVHACVISNILQGKSVEKSVDCALEILKNYKGYKGVYDLIKEAQMLAKTDMNPKKAIELLGEGWNGDEAIAISLYCALKSPNDFKKALIMSVNHSGDSDSTGAITGNILGAYLGINKIPANWKNSVELSNELKLIAYDLYVDKNDIIDAKTRYQLK